MWDLPVAFLLSCLSRPICLWEASALKLGTLPLPPQEYKRKQIEEQRQAERLQRQLQQERAYLVSLQQQQQQEARQAEKKQLYHYKDMVNPNDKPAWAKEVSPCLGHCLFFCVFQFCLAQRWSLLFSQLASTYPAYVNVDRNHKLFFLLLALLF